MIFKNFVPTFVTSVVDTVATGVTKVVTKSVTAAVTSSNTVTTIPITKSHQLHNYIIPTHPLHLFHIIQNVNEYQYFVPYCTHSKIITQPRPYYQNQQNQNQQHQQQQQQQQPSQPMTTSTMFDATLTVGIPPFLEETYISTVIVDHKQYSIESCSNQSKNQLFEQLKSKWSLQPILMNGNGTKQQEQQNSQNSQIQIQQPQYQYYHTQVNFKIEITTKDPYLISTVDYFLQDVTQKQIIAFTKRCQQIPISQEIIKHTF